MDDFSWADEPLKYDFEKNDYIYPDNFEKYMHHLPSEKKIFEWDEIIKAPFNYLKYEF